MTRLALALALVAGCSKKQDEGPVAREPLPAGELQQGRDACTAYMDKACACAAKAPDDAERKRSCAEATAFKESIELVQTIAASPGNKDNDLRQQAATIRATITACIEKANQLAQKPCP
ncbi:MAG: hypothetical protein KF773_01530 [Deltaproteobacteria bacterium]|nr:hypothetical protein [Deltaproteobacteria bacterium]MCW5806576.1 hypothetical protein [Deltaproteobacteria bacterium]